MEKHPILLFDGVCNLCNGAVQFIIERDEDGFFRFASLQSDAAKKLLEQYPEAPEDISTIVLLEKGRLYTKSDAALRAARAFGLNLAGVDLLRSDTGPKVLEVNSSPGFEGIETSTGKNIVGTLYEEIERRVRPAPVRRRKSAEKSA